jgi:replicative DNA helicase
MTGPRSENRTQEVTKISSALKSLAKEFDVPVVAISQLSRAPEGRSANGHRPMLSDLRESGAIEQDADLVVFMYREDYYPKADGTTQGEGTAEFIVAKQRNGPTDTVMLSFQREFTKFGNYVTDF